MNSILVTGAQGLVGSRFVELYKDKYQLLTPTLQEFDFLVPSLMKSYLKKYSVSHVINFAAYTDVAGAEKEKNNENGLCWRINVKGTSDLVNQFEANSIHFIHISTDMVFPADEITPGPYSEDSNTCGNSDRLTWYGHTKQKAEEIVKKRYPDTYSLLRINYPVRSKYFLKADFFRKHLMLFDSGKLYPLFSDQQISVSYIDEIALALDKIINNGYCGAFHASSEDVTTPHEIISYLIDRVRHKKNAVKGQTIEEFIKVNNTSPIRYPKYGGLKVETTEKVLHIKFSKCKDIVDKLILQGIK